MSKSFYLAAPGVAEANGHVVPADGRIALTPAEALYDLAHGRITIEPPADPAPPPPLPSRSVRKPRGGA